MPDNIYKTSSLLLASLIELYDLNPYIGYHEGQYCFANGQNTVELIIAGSHDPNLAVNHKKYEKARGRLVFSRRKALRLEGGNR